MATIKIHQQSAHSISYFQKGPDSIREFSEIGKLAKILAKDEVTEISFKQIAAVKAVIFTLADHISDGSLINVETTSIWMTFLRSLVFRMYRYTVKMILNSHENQLKGNNNIPKSKFRTMQAILDDIIHKMEELPE